MSRSAPVTHIAESTHWYDRAGKPAYTVTARDGSQRPTTLRDARKLALVPSVTTIIKCAAAPGLERWKLDQMMHAALTLPRGATEPEAEWISRVWADSKETASKAADRGTTIHAAIQGAFEDKTTAAGTEPYIQGVMEAVGDWYPDWDWRAERSFASSLGFGGKVDLSHGHAQFVLDFKTKEFDSTTDLKTWDEHAMQLAAYRSGLGISEARCAIVYVSVSQPGLVRLMEIPQEDLKKGWVMFYSLLQYWKAKNGYEPAFERLAA